MTVVRNEYEAGENSPFTVLFERTLSTAYLWHNYGKSTIGARSDIENVPIERLQAFYHKYYQPDNAVLVVAGKVDEAKVLKQIATDFGPIPRPVRSLERGNMIYPTYTEEPTQDGEREVSLRRTGDVQVAMALYHVPAGSHPDFAPVDVLTEILGNEPSGRLYKALVEPEESLRGTGVQHPTEGAELRRRKRDDAEGSVARGCTGDPHPDDGRGGKESAVRGRSGAREVVVAEGDRPAPEQFRQCRAHPHRVGRSGRLAPHVCAPRPNQEGHAGRRAARGRGVFQAGQPHRRPLLSHRQAGPRRDSAGHRRRDRGDDEGLQGDGDARRRRGL